jgi:hypothetical protein
MKTEERPFDDDLDFNFTGPQNARLNFADTLRSNSPLIGSRRVVLRGAQVFNTQEDNHMHTPVTKFFESNPPEEQRLFPRHRDHPTHTD